MKRSPIGIRELLANTERMVIMETLARNRWNRRLSALAMGISRTNLWQRMKKLDIDLKELPKDRTGRKGSQGQMVKDDGLKTGVGNG
jgi:DNA-binding NtrC family response regulator